MPGLRRFQMQAATAPGRHPTFQFPFKPKIGTQTQTLLIHVNRRSQTLLAIQHTFSEDSV